MCFLCETFSNPSLQGSSSMGQFNLGTKYYSIYCYLDNVAESDAMIKFYLDANA